MRACSWNVTDSNQPIFDLIKRGQDLNPSKEKSHDFVSAQSVTETVSNFVSATEQSPPLPVAGHKAGGGVLWWRSNAVCISGRRHRRRPDIQTALGQRHQRAWEARWSCDWSVWNLGQWFTPSDLPRLDVTKINELFLVVERERISLWCICRVAGHQNSTRIGKKSLACMMNIALV